MTINETIKKPNDIYDFSELKDINIDMLSLALSQKVKKILEHRLLSASNADYFEAYYSVAANLIDDLKFEDERLNKQNIAILDAISDMNNNFNSSYYLEHHYCDGPIKQPIEHNVEITSKVPPPVYWRENIHYNKWCINDWVFTARIDEGSNGEYKAVRFKTRPPSKCKWKDDEKIFPSYFEAKKYCSSSPENWGLGW